MPFLRSVVALSLLLTGILAANAADPPAKGGKYWLYIGTYTGKQSKGIYRAEFDPATGKLSEPALAVEVGNPTFLTVHPSGKYLYAVGETADFGGKKTGTVNAFTIDPKTGDLKLLNRESSGGGGPCHITTNKTGTYVFVANYGGGSVAALPIHAGGRLDEATGFVQHKGGSKATPRQSDPNAHSINLDPSNKFAVVADLGMDKLLVYKFDARKGTLTPNDPASLDTAPAAGPRHFAFHPDGKHAYYCGEIDSTVNALEWDADKGSFKKIQSLTTLPKPTEGNSTAEVVVHPSGKFVYVSNRGHNSIAIFKVDQKTGELSTVGHQGEGIKIPRNFSVDPSGTWLLVANQDGHSVIVFEINQDTGELKPTTTKIEVGAPVCLRFLAIPAAGKPDPKPEKPAAVPNWIWIKKASDNQTVFFRKDIEVRSPLASVKAVATCDNHFNLFIDGKSVMQSDEWESPIVKDVTSSFVTADNKTGEGKHVVAVKGHNDSGPAGLIVRFIFETKDSKTFAVVTDANWRVAEKEIDGWLGRDFDDKGWTNATVVAPLGGGSWPGLDPATFGVTGVARAGGSQSATPAEKLVIKKDFKAELLYSVPKDTEGSWVNMCVDPKGRLIVSDQYGSLYRITPPPIGGKTADTKVEKIDLPIGGAHGLLWAFDSLYVMVNEGVKHKDADGKIVQPRGGLYRVRSKDDGDTFAAPELLRGIDGSGEHGAHAVLLAPDGKSLFVVCGDSTKMVSPLSASRVPKLWGEDHLLPRMRDGNGFMAGVLGPGGCIYKVDPDGKDWELISTGYRNEFDAAFNHHGELFTYDADMEWDMNTPWYRPTRVCLATSGSEFGWRNGAGKWPPHYPDSLPAIYNVGPGSPTGMCFGYGAKFPAKYQEALFMCDWSYGKLYVLHLTPDGSAYKGELEEFLNGSPLPLTDVVVNPKDGALYFTIGGRKTQSGLYRVTYTGKESTASAKIDESGAEARALRHKLEAFHGKRDPNAVATAWPYLAHEDRYIRFAARTAIEHQDVATWQERALKETDPGTAIAALLAMVRATGQDPFHHPRKPGDPIPGADLQAPILTALGRFDFEKLTATQQLDLLRVYAILFNRTGKPDEATRKSLIAHFDALYPAKGRPQTVDLCNLLVFLESPTVATKTMKLIAEAPTQEEQMDYARALRVLKVGWTPELRKDYFTWFLKAANFKGGASMRGFINLMKADALATLSDTEKVALRPVIEAAPIAPAPVIGKPRQFVKEYKLNELTGVVEKGLQGRDFDRGRKLFGEANCFACHRYDNEGGALGPDLSGVAGRFSVRDLLESILDPSKEVSDQYAASRIELTDGRTITGRIVNQNGNSIMVMTNMLDPNGLTNVDSRKVESITRSKESPMPKGLLDTFKEDEILDLMAYLLSRGDRASKMFKP
jgi:putative heme-binding domain-containing protein